MAAYRGRAGDDSRRPGARAVRAGGLVADRVTPSVSTASGDYRYPAPRGRPAPRGQPGRAPVRRVRRRGLRRRRLQRPRLPGAGRAGRGNRGHQDGRGFVEQQGSPATRPARRRGYAQSGYPQPHAQPADAGTASRATRDRATPAGEIEMAYPPPPPTATTAPTSTASRGTTTSRCVTRAKQDSLPGLRQLPGRPATTGQAGTATAAQGGRRGRAVPAARFRPRPPTTAPTTPCRASTAPATTCPASSAPATSRRSATTSRATAASPTTTPATTDAAAATGSAGPRFDETRFDVPRFDETRLDNLWQAGDDVRREAGPAGYGNDGFGDSRPRSRLSFCCFDTRPQRPGRRDALRHAGRWPSRRDSTRFDVPVFDETRLDNLRPLTPAGGLRPPAPPARAAGRPAARAGPRTPRSTTSPTST